MPLNADVVVGRSYKCWFVEAEAGRTGRKKRLVRLRCKCGKVEIREAGKLGSMCFRCSSFENGLKSRKVMVGKSFGELLVIEPGPDSSRAGKGYTTWVCLCAGCDSLTTIRTCELPKRDCCPTCCMSRSAAKRRRDCGDLTGTIYGLLRRLATTGHRKKRGIVFDVSQEYLWSLFTDQGCRCAMTGLPISMGCRSTRSVHGISYLGRTASLDRIDSSVGYVPGNVRWVHKVVNVMRSDMTDEEFVNWCRLVAAHADRKG